MSNICCVLLMLFKNESSIVTGLLWINQPGNSTGHFRVLASQLLVQYLPQKPPFVCREKDVRGFWRSVKRNNDHISFQSSTVSRQSTLSSSFLSGVSLSLTLCESKWTLSSVLWFLKLGHLDACTTLVGSGLCCLSVSLTSNGDATEQGSWSDFFLTDDSAKCNRRWIRSLKQGSSSGLLQILTHFRLNITSTSIVLLLLLARRCSGRLVWSNPLIMSRNNIPLHIC